MSLDFQQVSFSYSIFFLPILCFSGDFNEKGLNFGRSDATSKDLEEQAMDLVSAIESDERIDMNTYWKVAIFH